MEKIKFMSEEMKTEVEFFVLEQTRINGVSYILVTDSEEGATPPGRKTSPKFPGPRWRIG